MRSIEIKRTTVLFVAALIIAALAASPAAPASATNCDGLPGSGGTWSGEYTMTDDCTLTGTINVNGSLTIHGNGYTIDAASNQAFDVGGGSLALDNVTVTNGYGSSFGGAIYNCGGTVTISNSTFSGNSSADVGGAIENYGTVTVSNSTFSGNSAVHLGGAINNWGGRLTVSGCSVFQGNTAGNVGDGILNFGGTVEVAGSVIYDEIYHGDGSTTAEGNWWGSEAGPGALANGFTVSSWWETNQCEAVEAGGGPVILPKCVATVPFGTADVATVSGEVRFFTDFGYDLPLQPEGWLVGAVETVVGQQTRGSVTVFCGNHVRAWLFDAGGNPVGLIPSQYENGDGVFTPYDEDYGVGGPEYGYLEAAPPLYTGSYAEMFRK